MSLYSAVLALEDGSVFYGTSIGIESVSVGEVVFNTAMTGYQEILTDPSYAKQIITLTYPHIGNTGINEEDEESSSLWAAGLVIRDLPLLASNFRNQEDLSSYLKRNQFVAIAEIDTRRLTRLLREKGALNGCIATGEFIGPSDVQSEDKPVQAALDSARGFSGLKGLDLAKEVTCAESYVWTEKTWSLDSGHTQCVDAELRFHVVAYDFGVKRNILRMLVDRGCRVTVVPAQTPVDEVLAMQPDGVFLSNGPGDPEPCTYAIEAIQSLLAAKVPLFGICLGHQLLALASGANTVKMKFGHHGANHPVKCLESDEVLITSQNHGFAVDQQSLPDCLRVTHQSLFDQSLQGIHRKDLPAFGFQGHPEASPGPHEAAKLFDHFIELIKTSKTEAG